MNGSGLWSLRVSSRRAVRARSMSRQTRATTVVSQPPRFSIPPASERLSLSQPSWTASSASSTEPSIRKASARRCLRWASNSSASMSSAFTVTSSGDVPSYQIDGTYPVNVTPPQCDMNSEELTVTSGIKTVIYPVKDLARAKALCGAVLGVEPYMDEAYCLRVEGRSAGPRCPHGT